jgi:hypothetical protein
MAWVTHENSQGSGSFNLDFCVEHFAVKIHTVQDDESSN